MAEPHLGDVISALVDGELAADEERAARAHLDGCADCRVELAGTEAMASVVRGLPAVEPRFGFYERLTQAGFATADRPGLRVGVAVATAAAVVALVMGMAGDLGGGQVAPPVDDLVEVHQAGFAPQTGFRAMEADDMAAMDDMGLPAELEGGFERSAVYEGGEVMAIAYRSGEGTVSVFGQEGRLDAGAMEQKDGMDDMDDRSWGMDLGGLHAVIVDCDGRVYTVVGDPPMAALMALAAELPDAPSRSLVQRARGAGAEVVWTFGLGH